MVCLFCKGSTETSVSIEHILPESLGNFEIVLPAGVVCDRCNNYFARKLEGPVLACGAFLEHRFAGCLPNKSGRVPAVAWTAFPSGIELAILASLAEPLFLVPSTMKTFSGGDTPSKHGDR